MKPLLWIAVGSVATGLGLLLLGKKSGPTPAPSPPPQSYGETVRVPLSVPSGWQRATNITPEIRAQAIALMNAPGFTSMQYGTLSPFVASDGKTYATWIEQHYHPPGGSAQPWGLHHGVTVLAQA